MSDFAKLAQDLLGKKPKKLTEYQEYGLTLADKLQDSKRLSLYIKLARDSKRALLSRALSFAIDYPPTIPDKGAIFLWKYYQLHKGEQKRLFLGLFPKSTADLNRLATILQPVVSDQKIAKIAKFTDLNKIHQTIAFYEQFPTAEIPQLIQKSKELQQKYGNEFPITIKGIKILSSQILTLYSTDPICYRLAYSTRKWYPTEENRKPRPHFTIARFQQPVDQNTYQHITNLTLQNTTVVKCVLQIVESYLTKEGYVYKIIQAIR